jgi:hypothetical protein
MHATWPRPRAALLPCAPCARPPALLNPPPPPHLPPPALPPPPLGVRTWQGDFVDLPPYMGTADAVIMNSVLGNLYSPREALIRASFLLKPVGHLVVSHPMGRDWHGEVLPSLSAGSMGCAWVRPLRQRRVGGCARALAGRRQGGSPSRAAARLRRRAAQGRPGHGATRAA